MFGHLQSLNVEIYVQTGFICEGIWLIYHLAGVTTKWPTGDPHP